MGIFDEIEGVGSELLKPIKKGANLARKYNPILNAAGFGLESIGIDGGQEFLTGRTPTAAEDFVKKYSLSAITGAGFGFLAGGPPGAVIGAGAGVGSQILGPVAGREVAKQTGIDELGTAAEFGVYGAGAGLGLGSGAKVAGKIGMEQLLARLALKSSVEMGALSGAFAAGGQGGAKALGLPEEFGILAGGVGGPMVGPYAFASLRTRAFNAENAGMRKLAETFGANEANAVKRSKAFEPTELIPGDQTPEETVRSLRASAESDRIQAARYQQPGDNEYRQFSGGYTRKELQTGVLEGTEGAQIYTPAFRRQTNSLNARNSRITAAKLQAESMIEQNADLLAQWPEGKTLEELKEQGGVKYFENPDGSAMPIPDDVWQARAAVEKAQAQAATEETKLRQILKLDDDVEIPGDLAEQRRLLRVASMPDAAAADSEATARFLAMSHRDRQALIKATDTVFEAETFSQWNKSANSTGRMNRANALADFVEAHPEKGFIPKELRQQAARDFEAVRQKEVDLARNPSGYVKPKEAPESFAKYKELVDLRANAHGIGRDSSSLREQRAQLRKELLFGDPETGAHPLGTYHHIDPETGIAKAKRLVSFDEEAGTATLRPEHFGTPEQDITVPLKDVAVRYDENQLPLRMSEQQVALQQYQKAGRLTPEQAAMLDEGLGVPALKDNEVFTFDRINQDLQFAQKAFEANFATTQSSMKGVFYTPEQEARVGYQFAEVLNRPIKGRLSREELKDRLEAVQYFRKNLSERTAQYLSVNDPEMLGVFNGGTEFDPLKSILHLAGNSVDEYRNIFSDSDVKLFGAAGQYMKKLAIGEVIRNPVVRQINGDIHAMMEASANSVGATYGILNANLERWAAEKTGVELGFKAQGKAAVSALLSERSIKAAVSELHPLSHKGAWGKLAQSYVDWSKASPALKASLKRLEQNHGPEYVEQFKLGVIQNKRFFAENQEMFVKPRLTKTGKPSKLPGEALAQDEVVQSFLRHQKLYDDTLERARLIFGDAPDTLLRRHMMNVSPEFREYVNIDALRQGSKRAKSVPVGFADEAGRVTPSTLADVADEVLTSLKAKGKENMLMRNPRPLDQLMVFGEEADMAVPLATHQSMAMRSAVDKLKTFAKDGEVLTADDIQFNGHGWHVRSLNKFPAEMRESIAGMNQVLEGKHQWAGLQRISQQIALGNLTADMSIMGIQGFKYLAHSLLAGNIGGLGNFAGAAKVKSALGTQTTHIMSDWGFYSWLRQNYDEVNYLSQKGLTGGLKGYIAGPDVGRLPLENIPLLGKAFTGIREGTDLAFNRLLFYWKVQGVRENMEFAKTMRAIPRDFAERFMNSSATAKATMDELGGLDGYLYGDKEAVLGSIVRQVNRSYGGVNMAAEGIGPTRQALEQIMTVVPGFFRAQAGQWASVLTKPNTVEGQLAISMLSREYLLAAGIVTGLAHVMGTQDKINFEDITKPTWLGLPLPNGDTISVLPTMAIPRMASRQIQNVVQAAQGEADFSPDRALEAFAHGRMSPMAGALYDTLHGQDFLGRKYDSNLEKYGMTMANVTLPILASSFIEDLKEGVKQNNATGDYNWLEIAGNAGINLIGKSTVPRHPVDRLNTIAQAQFQTDWNLLTDAEKNEIKKNPAAVMAEAEYDFYSMRRAGSSEQKIDSAYNRYESEMDKNWHDAQMIDGLKTSQNDDDQLLAAGRITGDTWRDRYQARQDYSSKLFSYLKGELLDEGVDPDKLREDKMKRLAEGRDPGSMAWLVQAAKTEYNGVKPVTEEQEIPTPSGVVSVGTVNWDKFHDDREAVLSKYPAAVAQRIRSGEDAKTPGIALYREAAKVQQEIESIPRYRGMTVEQGNKVDELSLVMSKFAESVKSQMGLPPGTAVPGLASQLRNQAVKYMTEQGQIKNEDDLQLASLAIMLQENPKLRASLMNMEGAKAVLENPEAVIYYPYLRHRVPKQLWPQLPAQVFNSELVQRDLLGG